MAPHRQCGVVCCWSDLPPRHCPQAFKVGRGLRLRAPVGYQLGRSEWWHPCHAAATLTRQSVARLNRECPPSLARLRRMWPVRGPCVAQSSCMTRCLEGRFTQQVNLHVSRSEAVRKLSARCRLPVAHLGIWRPLSLAQSTGVVCRCGQRWWSIVVVSPWRRRG